MMSKTDTKTIKSLVDNSIKKALVNRPTKDDLKNFATKDDLVGLARGTEIDELKITFLDNLAKWKDELYTKIDELVSNLKPAKEEQTVISGKLSEHSDLLEDHEQRITKLEQTSQTT